MKYVAPTAVVVCIDELSELVLTGACSTYGYVCPMPSLFGCQEAAFSNSCATYDSAACDPLAAPTAGHGNYPG